ncbi:hypothetical protein V8E53_007479 [Lactarius tabidus]
MKPSVKYYTSKSKNEKKERKKNTYAYRSHAPRNRPRQGCQCSSAEHAAGGLQARLCRVRREQYMHTRLLAPLSSAGRLGFVMIGGRGNACITCCCFTMWDSGAAGHKRVDAGRYEIVVPQLHWPLSEAVCKESRSPMTAPSPASKNSSDAPLSSRVSPSPSPTPACCESLSFGASSSSGSDIDLRLSSASDHNGSSSTI